ncbi:hypothetical protein F2Q70_00040524 [Brassica cretica]|uniref:Signal recognition particle 9 kDa protein n=1 Tax=Brassica cretica TaxID=69181 RepID=A0A8S9K1Y2_BRACR|nr:hypothetical protein F2Q70_00040524 [Brassica cretica]
MSSSIDTAMASWFLRLLITKRYVSSSLCFVLVPDDSFDADMEKVNLDQAQEAKKMEKLNNIFFTLMARGPDVDVSEVTGKEPMETQPAKKGRGRKQ